MNQSNPFDSVLVGRRLKALRMNNDMNQKEFALSVSIDETSYGKIEKGVKPLKAEMAFRVAERWGVTMDFLYRGRMTELSADLANKLMKNLTNLEA